MQEYACPGATSEESAHRGGLCPKAAGCFPAAIFLFWRGYDVTDSSKRSEFSYDGSYEPVFEHVSFQIDTNWKLGFTGRNGRGKTTFLRLLLGEFPYQGTISASVPFSYFPFP